MLLIIYTDAYLNKQDFQIAFNNEKYSINEMLLLLSYYYIFVISNIPQWQEETRKSNFCKSVNTCSWNKEDFHLWPKVQNPDNCDTTGENGTLTLSPCKFLKTY